MVTTTEPFGSGSRAYTTITEGQEKKYEQEKWHVHPEDNFTGNAIVEYLVQQGLSAELTTIPYGGKRVEGYSMPWSAVKILRNSRRSSGYKFIAYHREGTREWAQWQEGKKSPVQRLKNNDHLFKRTPRAKSA